MDVTIVEDDDLVIVDGYPLNFDLLSFYRPPGFWALQWREKNNSGEIEYRNKPNEKIYSLNDFHPIINEHQRLKKEKEEEENKPVPVENNNDNL